MESKYETFKQEFTCEIYIDRGPNEELHEFNTKMSNVEDSVKSRTDNASSLYVACELNYLSVVKYLMDNHKDDINNVTNIKRSPLHIACLKRNKEMVELLLNYKLDINKVDKNGMTPLYIAYKKFSIDIIELLLRAGAEPNLKDCEICYETNNHLKLSCGHDVCEKCYVHVEKCHKGCLYSDSYYNIV